MLSHVWISTPFYYKLCRSLLMSPQDWLRGATIYDTSYKT